MDMQRNVFELAVIPEPNSRYCRIGRLHCFFLDPEGRPRITLGPQCNKYLGPLMIACLILLISISGLFLIYICPKVSLVNLFIGIIQFLTTIILFLIVALANPGIVLISMQMKSKGEFSIQQERICNECNIIKDDYTEHCKKCKVCIEDFDDHYMLIGKCIGCHTINYFYFLLLSILTTSIFIISTLFLRYNKNF